MNTDFGILQGPVYRVQSVKAWRRSCSFHMKFKASSIASVCIQYLKFFRQQNNQKKNCRRYARRMRMTMNNVHIWNNIFCLEINLNENKYDCLRSGKITKFRVYSDHKTFSFPKLNNFFLHESRHPSVVWLLVHCTLACKSYGKYCSLIRNWNE